MFDTNVYTLYQYSKTSKYLHRQSFSWDINGCSLAKMFPVFYGTQISVQNCNHYHWGLSYLQYMCKSKPKSLVKFTLEQATKAQKGRRGIALLFL